MGPRRWLIVPQTASDVAATCLLQIVARQYLITEFKMTAEATWRPRAPPRTSPTRRSKHGGGKDRRQLCAPARARPIVKRAGRAGPRRGGGLGGGGECTATQASLGKSQASAIVLQTGSGLPPVLRGARGARHG
jgi:hypothetical protein